MVSLEAIFQTLDVPGNYGVCQLSYYAWKQVEVDNGEKANGSRCD